MLKILIGMLAILCAVQTACAESLTLFPAEVTWSSASSGSITLGITSSGTSELLAGWWLKCAIQKVGDATGDVSFFSFSTPTNYVFGDDSYGMVPPVLSQPSDVLGPISDYALDDGVEVSATNANLIQFEITASGAVGRFNIVINPDESGWASTSEIHGFATATGDVLASVVFPVPEPSGILMLWPEMVALVVVGIWHGKNSRRTRPVQPTGYAASQNGIPYDAMTSGLPDTKFLAKGSASAGV